MRAQGVLLREGAQRLHWGSRLSPLGLTHRASRSRTALSAKGNKLSGCCWPICSDETPPNPHLPLVSFQGISWRKDKQRITAVETLRSGRAALSVWPGERFQAAKRAVLSPSSFCVLFSPGAPAPPATWHPLLPRAFCLHSALPLPGF